MRKNMPGCFIGCVTAGIIGAIALTVAIAASKLVFDTNLNIGKAFIMWCIICILMVMLSPDPRKGE